MEFIQNLREKLSKTNQLNFSQYLCIEETFSKTSVLQWLKAQPHSVKTYWSDKDGTKENGMIGICHQVSDIDDPTRIMSANYFGGIGFDIKTSTWPEFGFTQFILPRVELSREGSSYSIKCHLDCRNKTVEEEVQACLLALEQLQPTENISQQEHTLLTRSDSPDKESWVSLIEQTLLGLKQGVFSKVVLSRETTLNFDQPIDAWDLLIKWQAINSNCFQFAFQYQTDRVFIGCSPERLYLRSGYRLTTESLAGTTLREQNEEEDQRLTGELLTQPKLRRENTLVLNDILSRLKKFSLDVRVDEAAVLKLDRIQHLKQRIHAYLREEITDSELLKALHPTPAVGGSPRDLTMDYIYDNEPYHRGWYAGAVGYISGESSEFCVAIRSALINQEEIKLYAGAGIVNGSDADIEWQELENKISTVLALLNVR